MSTYFIRASGGSDGNSGLDFANAWATITHAIATITAGDLVYVCADGIHYYTAGYIYWNNTTGTLLQPMTFRGASATGIDDGTVATISGNNTSNCVVYFNGSPSHYRLQNLHITECNQVNVNITSNADNGSIVFTNCEIDYGGGRGIILGESNTELLVSALHCKIHHNTTQGILDSTSCGSLKLFNSDVYNNGTNGYQVNSKRTASQLTLKGNRFYRNTGTGIYLDNYLIGSIIEDNVFFANTTHGIHIFESSTLGGIVCKNNIFKSNGGYGLRAEATQLTQFGFWDYNCYYDNTSGPTNINGGVPDGDHNVFADPLFEDETAGSEDFRLQLSSPCLNVGYGYNG